MERERYLQTAQLVFAVARAVEDQPLAELLRAIDLAETVGPFVDPTLYQQYLYGGGRETNQLLRDIAEHLIEVQKLVRAQKPAIRERWAAGDLNP